MLLVNLNLSFLSRKKLLIDVIADDYNLKKEKPSASRWDFLFIFITAIFFTINIKASQNRNNQ